MALDLPSGRYLTRTVNGLNIANSYTAMGWFYAAWANGNWHNVFFFGPNSSIHDNVEVDTTGKTIVSVDFSAGVTGTTLTSNTWHHWAVVRSSNTNWSLYLDGVLDCTETVDISGRSSNASAMIGNWAGAGDDLIGRLQDIKIWQAALTVDEIKQEMKRSVPFRWSNLLHWAPMRDQTVSRAEEDRSGRDGSWTEAGSGTVTISEGAGAGVPYSSGDPYIQEASGGTTMTGSATLAMVMSLTASAAANTTGSATLGMVLSLTASAAANTTGSATLGMVLSLTASAAADATGSATLPLILSLTASAAADATGSATLPMVLDLTASAIASITGSATLPLVLSLAADGTTALLGSATLPMVLSLTASAAADATGSATLPLVLSLTASGSIDTMTGSASLGMVLGLTAEPARWASLGMVLGLSPWVPAAGILGAYGGGGFVAATADQRYGGKVVSFPWKLELVPVHTTTFDKRVIEENMRRISDWISPFGGKVPEAYQLARLIGGAYGTGRLAPSGATDGSADIRFGHDLGRVPRMVFLSIDLGGLGGQVYGLPAGGAGAAGGNQTRWTTTEVYLRASREADYAFILI